MQTPAPSNPRKRPSSDQYPHEGEACQIVSKKQKSVHIPAPLEPAASQEDSSATRLEKSALKALRRQHRTQTPRKPRSSQRSYRPATRLAVADWQRSYQPLKPADTYLENCGQEQYRALQSFAKHGGPDLQSIRGCHRPPYRISNNPMAPIQANSTTRSRSRPSTKTKPTEADTSNKSLSTYNRVFQQAMIDYRVFPPHYRDPDGNPAPEPDNWDYINERLAQPRSSLSPSKFSKEQHNEFVDADASAAKEIDVKKNVIPIIQGKLKDLRAASGDIPFTNLLPLTTDETLVVGNPDIYHGARPEQLDRRIRNELGQYILPSTQHDLPMLPNHMTAAKGPDGSAAVALRQATYDIHFGVRAMDALKCYGQAEVQHDGNAYAFSSIYHNGQLKLFTSHSTAPLNPGERPGYHMNHLRSFAMDDRPESWREGATWYRNSIELAKEFRDDAIRAANQVVNRPQAPITPFASNMGESFASTGSQIGLESLTVDSQVVETAQGVANDTAESSQDDVDEDEEQEEDEPRPPSPKRSGQPRRQRRKRQNQEDSDDTENTLLSKTSPQASSGANEREGRGRGRKKLVR